MKPRVVDFSDRNASFGIVVDVKKREGHYDVVRIFCNTVQVAKIVGEFNGELRVGRYPLSGGGG